MAHYQQQQYYAQQQQQQHWQQQQPNYGYTQQQPSYSASSSNPNIIAPKPISPTTNQPPFDWPSPPQQHQAQQQSQAPQGGRSRSATVTQGSHRSFHRPSMAPSPDDAAMATSGHYTSDAPPVPRLAPAAPISPPSAPSSRNGDRRPNLQLGQLTPTLPPTAYSPRSSPSSPAPSYQTHAQYSHAQRPHQPPSPALSSRSTLVGTPSSPTPSQAEKIAQGWAGPDNNRMLPAGRSAGKSDMELVEELDQKASRAGLGRNGTKRWVGAVGKKSEASPWLSKQSRGSKKLKYFSVVSGFLIILVIGAAVAYHFLHKKPEEEKKESGIKGFIDDGPTGPRATNVAQAPAASHGRRAEVEVEVEEMRMRHRRWEGRS